MKKVFMSLAAVAFIAAGSLTVTSCGSDDSTPGPGPSPETPGKLKIDNEEFALDFTETYIWGFKDSQGQNQVAVGKILPTGATDSVLITKWAIDSFDGDDASSASNFHSLEIFVPLSSDNKIVAPHQAQNIYLAGAFIKADGEEINIGQQLKSFDLNIDVFVETDSGEGGNISYNSTLSADKTVNVNYTGELSGTWLYIPSSGKNIKNKKSSSVKVSNLSELNYLKTKF